MELAPQLGARDCGLIWEGRVECGGPPSNGTAVLLSRDELAPQERGISADGALRYLMSIRCRLESST